MLSRSLGAVLRRSIQTHLSFLGCPQLRYLTGSIKLTSQIHQESTARTRSSIKLGVETYKKQSINSLLAEVVPQYPFKQLPAVSLQEIMQLSIEQDSKEALIAWLCLQSQDKSELKKAYEYLFPQKRHLQFIERKMVYTGQVVFSGYFQKLLPKMIDQLNSSTVDVRTKVGLLNTLVHMRTSEELKNHIRLIKRRSLSGLDEQLLFAVMINLKARHRMPYADYLSLLEESFMDSSEQQPSIEVAYILSSVPYFYRYYPKIIVKAIFLIFRSRLNQLNNQAILVLLKKVYQNNSKYSRLLAEDLLSFIANIDTLKHPSRADSLLPLIFKLIDYCQVLQIDSQPFVATLQKSITKLASAIQREHLTLELFSIRLFQKCQSGLSSACLQQLQKLIGGSLDRFMNLQQINQKELLGVAQLMAKFRKDLSKKAGRRFAVKLLHLMNLIHNVQGAACFECLNAILSLEYLFKDRQCQLDAQNYEQVTKLLCSYFQGSCQRLTGSLFILRNFNEVITLLAKSQACQIALECVPNVCGIKFKDLKGYSMDIGTLCLLLEYLVQNKLNSPHELLTTLSQLQFIVFSFFNAQQIPFKSTLHILQIAATCEYRNSNLYTKVQRAFFEIIEKYSNFKMVGSQLGLLRRCLVDRGLANPTFKELVLASLERPQNWEVHRENYLKKETSFHKQFKRKAKLTDNASLYEQQ